MKILLTGQPGIGKTTLLQKVADLLLEQQAKLMSCVVKEKRFHGRRESFSMHYFPDLTESVLASRVEKLSENYVASYSVNTKALKENLFPFMESMASCEEDTILVFDEIGRMQRGGEPLPNARQTEWEQDLPRQFIHLVDRLMASQHHLLATLVYDDEEWARKYKMNLPHVHLLTVNEENRDSLPSLILSMMRLDKKESAKHNDPLYLKL